MNVIGILLLLATSVTFSFSEELKSKISDENCQCGNARDPVCGSNWETFTNLCLLKCYDPTLQWISGPCNECQNVHYGPVCGKDRVTYYNVCEAFRRVGGFQCLHACPCPPNSGSALTSSGLLAGSLTIGLGMLMNVFQ